MYQAINEKTDERTEMFWSEDDLIEHLEAVSVPGDFWDVIAGGRLAYYYSLTNPTRKLQYERAR